MKLRFYSIFVLILLTSCGTKKPAVLSTSTNPTTKSSDHVPLFDVFDYSDNKKYGIDGKYPVKVGGKSVENQRRYLSTLAGPNGEELEFYRVGSCCPYKSENSSFGKALVDMYSVTYEGLKEPIIIYISFYDSEKLYIPKGFTKNNFKN